MSTTSVATSYDCEAINSRWQREETTDKRRGEKEGEQLVQEFRGGWNGIFVTPPPLPSSSFGVNDEYGSRCWIGGSNKTHTAVGEGRVTGHFIAPKNCINFGQWNVCHRGGVGCRK